MERFRNTMSDDVLRAWAQEAQERLDAAEELLESVAGRFAVSGPGDSKTVSAMLPGDYLYTLIEEWRNE